MEGTALGRIEVMKAGDTDRCHLAVRVSDMEQAIAELSARGIEVEEPVISPGAKMVYLKEADPAGNRVQLLWREGHE